MKQYKVLSDTHFGHEKLFALRGFESVDEMDEAIIKRWNELIDKNDKVIHLGDFSVGGSLERIEKIIGRLNGKITLVLGNHDTYNKIKECYIKHFKCVSSLYAPPFYFSHEPINEKCLDESVTRQETINVHGHLHNDSNIGDKYINMNLDAVGLDNMVKVFSVRDER